MVEQLSVFLENKAGRLADLTSTLGQAGHNMRTLVVADTSEFGVARVIVDRPRSAKTLLEEAGFGVAVTVMIAVEVADRPGGLSAVLDVLGEAGVNIEYAYCFVPPEGGAPVAIFRVEDVDGAVSALEDAGVSVIEPSRLYTADGS